MPKNLVNDLAADLTNNLFRFFHLGFEKIYHISLGADKENQLLILEKLEDLNKIIQKLDNNPVKPEV